MQSIIFEEIAEDSSGHRVALERLAKSFNSSKRVVALTGAGISVSAGIPVNYQYFNIFIYHFNFFNLGFSISWRIVRKGQIKVRATKVYSERKRFLRCEFLFTTR